ncbi:uncharacterized protein LOC110366511 isoform X2 [Fundulus heteroclitus]|nr:uncharacterized protein LOC110366511 isoform X2 [Fundulus heteroclitus]
MDGVLDGAVVLSACKLVCSLLFLPSLVASHSPVSFCCCSLLIFTDFLVTASLSFLRALKFWLTELNPSADVIALRFLLFLSHTYGAALLLTTFLIAMETLIRVLWPHAAAAAGTADRDGEAEEDGSVSEEGDSLPQVVGFFCCLSLWIAVAFSVRWHVKLEEGWTAACLDATDSLVRCLPNFFSAMQSVTNPCWSVAFLILLGLLLSVNAVQQRRNQSPAEPKSIQALHRATPATVKLAHPEMFMAKCVDRDCVLVSHDCLPEKRGRQELKRAQRHVLLPFIREQHIDCNQTSRWQLWRFPSLEENATIGYFSILCIFMLPFYLSVNILLIRTIDALLQGCIKSLHSYAANRRDSPAPRRVTQV